MELSSSHDTDLPKLSARERAIAVLTACCIGFLPAVLTILLVKVKLGASITSFHPVWSDELFYWHQILSFSQTGFGNGYYTFNELPARAGFTHYGPHGPMFPLLYGTFGRSVGWQAYSGPVFNSALCGAALALYASTVARNRHQQITAVLAIASYWPLALYLPSTMQESVHATAAIVMAFGFARIMQQHEALPTRSLLLMGGLICCIALMRPTWSVLSLPLFLCRAPNMKRGQIAVALGLSAALVAGVFVLFQWMSAPYPNYMSNTAELTRHSAIGALTTLLHHASGNIHALFNPQAGNRLELMMRLQLLLLLVFAASLLFFPSLRARLKSWTGTAENPPSTLLFHICNLGIPFLFVIFFYDVGDWRDYRVLAPHLLLSLLVLIASGALKPVLLVAAGNILCVSSFLALFSTIHADQFKSARQPSLPLSRSIQYRPAADPWCNTVLLDFDNLGFVPQIPAGIGTSFIVKKRPLSTPLKSRYLMLSARTHEELNPRLRTQELGTTPTGTLYLNLDCQCG